MEEIEQQPFESLSEWAERVVTAANAFIDKFVAIVRPYFDAISEIMKKFYDWIYSIYLEDGAPYGETPEGMQLWFEQRMRETQERAAVEWAEQRRRDLEDMRELGRKIGRRGLSPG